MELTSDVKGPMKLTAAELHKLGIRDAVKPLFLFMRKHGLEFVTLERAGSNCQLKAWEDADDLLVPPAEASDATAERNEAK